MLEWDSIVPMRPGVLARIWKGLLLEMKGNIKAVIFDFDYTLADSSKGIIECINYALRELGLNSVTTDAACETIGLSLGDTFLS